MSIQVNIANPEEWNGEVKTLRVHKRRRSLNPPLYQPEVVIQEEGGIKSSHIIKDQEIICTNEGRKQIRKRFAPKITPKRVQQQTKQFENLPKLQQCSSLVSFEDRRLPIENESSQLTQGLHPIPQDSVNQSPKVLDENEFIRSLESEILNEFFPEYKKS